MKVSVLLLALLLAGCGDDSASTTAAPATSAAPTSAVATTTAPPVGSRAGVAGLVTGRGDDGSIEVTVWLEGEPGALVVGFDSDDSLTDPAQAAGAEAEVLVGVAGGVVVEVEAGGVVTDGENAAGFDAVSGADGSHTVVRLFVLSDSVPRTGSVWVWVEGDAVAFGAALGGSCDPSPADRPAGVGPSCREAAAA